MTLCKITNTSKKLLFAHSTSSLKQEFDAHIQSINMLNLLIFLH